MFAKLAKIALSRKFWLERDQWPYCEMGAFVDDQSSGNQGNEGVHRMQLQTVMQQMQVQKCTTQLHSPLLLPLWKEGFLQLNCHVSLLSLSGHSVTQWTKLGVPPPGFYGSCKFFCDDVLWCSFFIGCFDILSLFDLFSYLWSLVGFDFFSWFGVFMVVSWCSVFVFHIFVQKLFVVLSQKVLDGLFAH